MPSRPGRASGNGPVTPRRFTRMDAERALERQLDEALDRVERAERAYRDTPWWRPMKRRRNWRRWQYQVGVVQGIDFQRRRGPIGYVGEPGQRL